LGIDVILELVVSEFFLLCWCAPWPSRSLSYLCRHALWYGLLLI